VGVMADEEKEEDSTPVPSRGAARKRGRWPVRITGEDREFLATDLSANGLFLRDLVHLEAGSHLHLEVSLADGTMSTGATVRWVRARRITSAQLEGCGLLFDELSTADRALVTAELDREVG
jgi:hypothetical protein